MMYKDAISIEETLDFLESQKGKHFDPVLVDIFLANLNSFLKEEAS